MVVNSINAALQDREVAFNGIGVGIATNIFFGGMVDGLVTGEALVGFQVDSALIGAQVRLCGNLFFDDRLHISRVDVRNMEADIPPIRGEFGPGSPLWGVWTIGNHASRR